jgi:diguanylate cyclase (GGDEF)-like protein
VVIKLEYTGRFMGLFIVLISSLGVTIYHYLSYGHLDKIHFIVTMIYGVFGWWLGKQYDKQKFYSQRDYLTNTYNRRFVSQLFPKLASQMDRSNKNLCICMIDIDNFKKTNDTYGHKVGDEVLENLSDLLSKNTRKSDFVARWGGDEFLIIAPFADKAYSEAIYHRLRNGLQERSSKLKTGIDVSIGFAYYPNDAKSLDELIKAADYSMYKLKFTKKLSNPS